MKSIKEKIINELLEVYDPEIPINVYDLGLIYEINPKKDGKVHIVMTLTSPTCPTAEYMQTIIREAAEIVVGVGNVDLELTFEPAWSPDKVSISAKEELGLTETTGLDLGVKQVFESKKSKDNLCFKCSINDKKIPLLSCSYKGENVYICNKCLLSL